VSGGKKEINILFDSGEERGSSQTGPDRRASRNWIGILPEPAKKRSSREGFGSDRKRPTSYKTWVVLVIIRAKTKDFDRDQRGATNRRRQKKKKKKNPPKKKKKPPKQKTKKPKNSRT